MNKRINKLVKELGLNPEEQNIRIIKNEDIKTRVYNALEVMPPKNKIIKNPVFKPSKIIAVAAVVLLAVGLINIQTVIAFFNGLFFIPGIGLTENENIKYYGLEGPFEIETKFGVMKIEYISKVTQGSKTSLNIYMTTKDYVLVNWLDPLTISAYNGGEMIFEKKVMDRMISHDTKAFFFVYKDFPEIDTFDLNLYGSSATVSLKEINDAVAFSKENNGVTLAVQKVKDSESMYFTGLYGADINPGNYRFSGTMSRLHSYAYDKNGNIFELLDQGAERFFDSGFSVGFNKNANEIKGYKCDRLELYYSKMLDVLINTALNGPIDFPMCHPFDIFELPIPKNGETIQADIEIPIGQYLYKITSVSREGDKLYIEDNAIIKFKRDGNGAVSWEPMRGTPEYERAVENQEYFIGWASLTYGDLTEDMHTQWIGWPDKYEGVNRGIIKNFDKNAESLKIALVEIQIIQYGDFNVEFE